MRYHIRKTKRLSSMKQTLLLCLALVLPIALIQAQISISQYGQIYSEDFNSLPASGSTNTWTNNTTLNGWHTSFTQIEADNGNASTTGLKSYGSTNDADRALGYLGGSPFTPTYVAVVFRNDADTMMLATSLSFTLENWRCTSGIGLLRFSYKTASSWNGDLVNGYTSIFGVSAVSDQSCTAGALDGNSLANQTQFDLNQSFGYVQPGEYLIFRITINYCTTCSRGIGIDDLQVQFFPDFCGSYYRSNGTGGGQFSYGATWENAYSPNGPFFTSPFFNCYPEYNNSDTIIIRTGDSVYVDGGYFWVADQMTVEEGAVLGIHDNAFFLTNDLNVDCNAPDLIVNGKLEHTSTRFDGFNAYFGFVPNIGQWQMGPNGSVRHAASQAVGVYMYTYAGECNPFNPTGAGMANIPPTSSFTFAPDATFGTFYLDVDLATYPNLTLENPNSTPMTIVMEETVYFTTLNIRGDLNIGLNGNPLEIQMVNFTTGLTNALWGNLNIGPNATLTNYGFGWGSGLRIINGDITITGNGKLDFSNNLNTLYPVLSVEGTSPQTLQAPDSSIVVSRLIIDNTTEVLTYGDIAIITDLTFDDGILTPANNSKVIMDQNTFGFSAYIINNNIPVSYINGTLRQYFSTNYQPFYYYHVGRENSPSGCDYNPFQIDFLWFWNTPPQTHAYFDLSYNESNQQAVLPMTDTCTNRTYTNRLGAWTVNFSTNDSLDFYIYPQDACNQLSGPAYTVIRDGNLPYCNQFNYYHTGGLFEYAVSGTIPLAVDFLNFSLAMLAHEVQLNWEIDQPGPASIFYIEKSKDGQSFQTIGQVQSTPDQLTYRYIDPSPFTGQNYYRIREAAADATFTFSKIQSIYNSSSPIEIMAQPTVVTDRLTLISSIVSTEQLDFSLYSTQGQLISHYTFPEGAQHMEITNLFSLPAGWYIIHWAKQNLSPIRFLKQ